MRIATVAFLLAALPALPAASASLTATGPDAPRTLANAKAGDTIVLTGEVPSLTIAGREGLTIDATAAHLNTVMIKGSKGIVWKGGHFDPNNWQGGLYVQDSSKVTIDGPSIFGADKFNGVFFRDSTDVALNGARIDRARVAVNFLNVTGGAVRGVAITGAAIDGVDIASSHKVLVEYSVCAGNLLADDHHPDCVQMWTNKGTAPVSDVTIRYNMVHGSSQGLNLFDHGTGGGENIVIEDNVIEISYPQAIALNNVRNSKVSGNLVRTLPGAKWRASINVDPNVARTKNRVEGYGEKPSMIDPN
jgi:hypothetical protein